MIVVIVGSVAWALNCPSTPSHCCVNTACSGSLAYGWDAAYNANFWAEPATCGWPRPAACRRIVLSYMCAFNSFLCMTCGGVACACCTQVPRSIQPSKARPNRNEPALLPHVLKAVAAARGETEEQVARQTTEAACKFFGLPQTVVA